MKDGESKDRKSSFSRDRSPVFVCRKVYSIYRIYGTPFFRKRNEDSSSFVPLFLILLHPCQKTLIEEGDAEFFSLPIKESKQPIFGGFQ
ncbi:hypothetical protein DLM78_07330 [Leptospira stimsonii]|uniref:Uncharacterized protein n=1 Tax=Leptospira stimsonii TaxID=2202203 RepID=A0A8B3D1S6_9LEPT|nr:hypothetical protein DLM78_07330 [Leptospira stimsonii]